MENYEGYLGTNEEVVIAHFLAEEEVQCLDY